MTMRTADAVLAVAFLLTAAVTRLPLRRCALTALAASCAGMTLVPSLWPAAGHRHPAAEAVAAAAGAAAVALALLLITDAVLLMRSQGLAAPQAATFAAGVLLAVAVGTISLDGRRTHRPPAPAWLLLALLTVYVTAFFVCFLCSTALRGRQRLRGRADSIIVLGAGLEDGKITPLLAHRLDRAVALHRTLVAAGADPVFIVSGGQGADEEQSEAEAMARHAVARGVPAERVHRENHSHNTDQNLTYSAVLLKLVGRTDRRVVVVSSDFHVMRVALIMDRLGLRGTVVGSRTKLPYWLTAALREFVAIVSYDRTATLGLTALLVLPATALALPWS